MTLYRFLFESLFKLKKIDLLFCYIFFVYFCFNIKIVKDTCAA